MHSCPGKAWNGIGQGTAQPGSAPAWHNQQANRLRPIGCFGEDLLADANETGDTGALGNTAHAVGHLPHAVRNRAAVPCVPCASCVPCVQTVEEGDTAKCVVCVWSLGSV